MQRYEITRALYFVVGEDFTKFETQASPALRMFMLAYFALRAIFGSMHVPLVQRAGR